LSIFHSLFNRAEKSKSTSRVPTTVAGPSGLHVEKRRYARYADGRATFIFPVIGNSREVIVQNASGTGVHLTSRETLEVGSRMHLIVFYGGGASARFIVQVLRESTAEGDRRRHYGARLLTSNRAEEAQLQEYMKFLRLKPSTGGRQSSPGIASDRLGLART
jgi:hypothetical protein